MIEQVRYDGDLERMHARNISTVDERNAIRAILAVKVVQFLVLRLHRWCVCGEERAQIGNRSQRAHGAEQGNPTVRPGTPMAHDPRPDCRCVQATVLPIKTLDEFPALLVSEAVQIGFAHLVAGSTYDASRLLVLGDEILPACGDERAK